MKNSINVRTGFSEKDESPTGFLTTTDKGGTEVAIERKSDGHYTYEQIGNVSDRETYFSGSFEYEDTDIKSLGTAYDKAEKMLNEFLY